MTPALIVTHDFPPGFTGGIASWSTDLAHALAAAGHPVTVLARDTGDTHGADQGHPYDVVRMRGRSWNRAQGAWAALAGWRRPGPGSWVVFATWGLATVLGPIARRRGAKVAIAFHGSDLTRLSVPDSGFRRAVASAHALLPVSHFLAAELTRLGLPGDDPRVTVLPMPVHLPPAPATGPRSGLLVVARLTPLKGVDRAIALARRAALPLTIVGDGPADADLRAEAARGWGAPVHFLGRRDRAEVEALLRKSAAAVLLPRPDSDGAGAEGLGLCLLEAAAQATPAIGCRTGGVPEAVGEGLIIENPDAFEVADIDAVNTLVADREAGERAFRWLAAHHGPHRSLAALTNALSRSVS